MSSPSRSRIPMVPHDPLWAGAFLEASDEIRHVMGDNLLQIHHIGSTAIPGIHAKPVIDLLAVVAEIVAVEQSNAGMIALGYMPMGEFGLPGRRYFRRDNADGERTHQVHAYQIGSTEAARHLAFRDYLRAHPSIAQTYSHLKQQLARDVHDMDAYMDGKDPFIKAHEAKALAWQRAL